MTIHDEHGNPTSGSATATTLYDRAVDRAVRLHPEVVELAGQMMAEHPDDAMGNALVAYLHLSSTDPADLATGAAVAQQVVALAGNEREALHGRVTAAWAAGDWHGASRLLDELLVRWPADLLALNMGHLLDFATGDAANLRDRVARSRRAFDPAHPHHGIVTGMAAFGLEESGHYSEAEAAALAALDRNPDDVWALHAGAHVYEMQGRVDEGIRFMVDRVADWGSGNLFTVHNWWHLALYHLEAGDIDGVLSIYDGEIHHADSAPASLSLLDATAMLWRLRSDGVDVGDRFARLASVWDTWEANGADAPNGAGQGWYAFNDFHQLVTYCGAGRLTDARRVLDRLAAAAEGESTLSNTSMSGTVALPAGRAFVAITEGRHADAVADLAPVIRRSSVFGGSHAQRDLLVRALTDAAIAAGETDLATSLLAQRIELRPSSVYGGVRLASVLRANGQGAAADEQEQRAERSRGRFAAALAERAVVA